MPDTSLPGEDPELLLLRLATHVLSRIKCVQVPVEIEQPYKGKLLVLGYYPDGRRPPAVPQLPFRMFSDREQRVVDLFLARGNPRMTRTAAAKILWNNDRPDPSDLATFTGLLERRVLEEPEEGKGVRLTAAFLAFAEAVRQANGRVPDA